jgi:hypothetical protein
MNTSGPPLSRPNAPARRGYLRKTLLKGAFRVEKKRLVFFFHCILLLMSTQRRGHILYKYFNRLVGWVRLIQESGAKWAYTVRLAKYFGRVCAREYDLILCAHCKLLRSCMPRSRNWGYKKSKFTRRGCHFAF